MKLICTFRKAMMLTFIVMVSIVTQGQTFTSGPIQIEGQQSKLDMRNIVWSDVVKNLPERVTLTRGDNLGAKWIDRISNMPDYLTTFYINYGQKVKDVLEGKSNWLSDPSKGIAFNGGYGYYTPINTFTGTINFTFPKDASQYIISKSAESAANTVLDNNWNEANSFMGYLSLCLNFDYPEAFWTGNQTVWGYSSSYSYSWSPSTGTGTIEYNQNVYLLLSDYNFDYRIKNFQTQQMIIEAVKEFNTKVESIVSLYNSGSRYDQVVGFNDWLTHHNSYNAALLRNEQNVNEIAWSPMSALRESTGDLGPVCEGYARAYKVLCDKAGIPCVLANGNAKGSKYSNGEGHMWNEVQMEDGKWYAVDVTWNDPTSGGAEANQKVSGLENHSWLLMGKNDMVGPNFSFAESHPVSLPHDPNNMWDLSFGSLIADKGYQLKESTNLADINHDGKVDNSDLKIIIECIMGKDTEHLGAADLNKDSLVNAADIVCFVKLQKSF